jgi:hypothetical protein
MVNLNLIVFALGLALIARALLAVTIITGKTILAVIVIGLATLGILVLAADWLRERSRRKAEPSSNEPSVTAAGLPDMYASSVEQRLSRVS